MQAKNAFFDNIESRKRSRRTLRLLVNAEIHNGHSKAVIHDLSEAGILIETKERIEIGEWLHVDIPDAGLKLAQVTWGSGQFFGCKFSEEISKSSVSATVLRSPPQLIDPDTVIEEMKSVDSFDSSSSRHQEDYLSERQASSVYSLLNRSNGSNIRVISIGFCLISWAFLFFYIIL